jgi:NADH-quinone oxidoreductase subunit G
VLNARIRKAWLKGANVIGSARRSDLTYDVIEEGTDRVALVKAAKGRRGTEGALVIVGQGALTGADGAAVWPGNEAGRGAGRGIPGAAHRRRARGRDGCGAVTEGGMAAALDGADVVFNLGADEIEVPAGPFVIYQGSHGDRGAHRADIILPAPPTPKSRDCSSTPRGARNWRCARASRRARPRRTGRSCGRFRPNWA